jgi:hypothetical protein
VVRIDDVGSAQAAGYSSERSVNRGFGGLPDSPQTMQLIEEVGCGGLQCSERAGRVVSLGLSPKFIKLFGMRPRNVASVASVVARRDEPTALARGRHQHIDETEAATDRHCIVCDPSWLLVLPGARRYPSPRSKLLGRVVSGSNFLIFYPRPDQFFVELLA